MWPIETVGSDYREPSPSLGRGATDCGVSRSERTSDRKGGDCRGPHGPGTLGLLPSVRETQHLSGICPCRTRLAPSSRCLT